ncbi:transcriptional regulator CtsR [Bacillaceae bacterium]
MRSISDIIEQHLKNILQQSHSGVVEIQRSELADKFQCVPSQINYVISTRFTVEKGYLVESKRGGGGFIRIRKIDNLSKQKLYDSLMKMIDDSINQNTAEGIIERLKEENIITSREANLMRAAISREVLHLQLPVRDRLRSAILKSLIRAIFFH